MNTLTHANWHLQEIRCTDENRDYNTGNIFEKIFKQIEEIVC